MALVSSWEAGYGGCRVGGKEAEWAAKVINEREGRMAKLGLVSQADIRNDYNFLLNCFLTFTRQTSSNLMKTFH
jgi:hypothetical protein